MVSSREAHHFLTIAKRRKTTYEFSDKPVAKPDIQKILEAARWAPSCSNVQPWHFIVVQDKERIRGLMNLASFGVFHTDPPLVIALILDAACWETGDHRCVKNDKVGTLEAYLCIAMPALSMVFEAESLGIKTCMLTPEMEKASTILGLRNKDSLPIMIGFGYEKKGAFQKKRKRKPLKKLVSYEVYGRKR